MTDVKDPTASPIPKRNGPLMISVAGLKQRGWTDGLTARFLGEPDKLVPNPHYRSGPKMRLYALDRVEEVEGSEPAKTLLARAQAQRERRSEAALKVNAKKREILLKAISSIPIDVPRFDFDEVKAAAIRDYNDLWSSRGNYEKHATIDSDKKFLNRVIGNYIRHALVDYDAICSAMKGLVGRDEAYLLFRERIMAEIFTKYPELIN